MKALDLTLFVFVCPSCTWQVQGGARARSDLGGGAALAEALAVAAAEHNDSNHDDPATAIASTGLSVNYLIPTSLPRWWVDR